MSDFRHDPNQVPNNIEVEIPSYLKWIYGGVGAVLMGGLMLFVTPHGAPGDKTSAATRAPNHASQPRLRGRRCSRRYDLSLG